METLTQPPLPARTCAFSGPRGPQLTAPHVPDTSPDAAVLAHCLPHVKSSEATAARGGTAVLGYQSAGHGGLAPESVLRLG